MSAGINLAGGNANPSISGASGLENIYVIDGVNITDYRLWRLGCLQFDLRFARGWRDQRLHQGNRDQDRRLRGRIRSDYSVASSTSSRRAAATGSPAACLAIRVRRRRSVLATRNLVTPNGTVNTASVDDHDFGLSVGGPIVPNRLFFFGTYNPQGR